MHYQTILSQYKSRREMLNINQETLADIAGISIRTLKQFERGKGNPTLKTLSKLAAALGMEISLQTKQLNNIDETQ